MLEACPPIPVVSAGRVLIAEVSVSIIINVSADDALALATVILHLYQPSPTGVRLADFNTLLVAAVYTAAVLVSTSNTGASAAACRPNPAN